MSERLFQALRRSVEPWWVVRLKTGDFEVVRAESRVMARFEVETADDYVNESGHADGIAWIEGPFSRRPHAARDRQ